MNNKLKEKKLQYKDIADMKHLGLTEREIAKKLNCTHQNISLKIKKYFSDEKFPENRGKKSGYSKFGFFTLKCKHCGKETKLSKTENNLLKKFCSFKCYLLNSGRRININVRKMTKDEFRTYHRIRCNKWYQANKNKPYLIELRKKYNRNAWLKRKEMVTIDK
jgi:hypothetical protein